MTNQISNGSGLLWKPGTRSPSVEFADCKKLQSQEPDTFALLTLQDHFKTSDDRFEYTVYRSRFGFSVGRKKKAIVEHASMGGSQNYTAMGAEKQETSLTFHANNIVRIFERMEKNLENLTSSLDNLIYCLCAENNIDREKVIKQ